MNILLHMMATSHQGTGGFLYNTANDTFQSTEADSVALTGSLAVQADGEIRWTGGSLGNHETGHTWWFPIGSVVGTYHARLSYVSGSTIYSSGESLATWVDLSTGNKTWNFSSPGETGPNTNTGVYSLDFSDDAGATTLETKNQTFDMFNESI
jgi:hypothetical protein